MLHSESAYCPSETHNRLDRSAASKEPKECLTADEEPLSGEADRLEATVSDGLPLLLLPEILLVSAVPHMSKIRLSLNGLTISRLSLQSDH